MLTRMQNFLASANTEEKLAFIRDADYWYILTSAFPLHEIKKWKGPTQDN